MSDKKITPKMENALNEIKKLRGDELGRFLDIISVEYFGIRRWTEKKEK